MEWKGKERQEKEKIAEAHMEKGEKKMINEHLKLLTMPRTVLF